MNNIKYLILFFMLIGSASCEKEIKVKVPEHKPSITVFSNTDGGDFMSARIGRSIGILNYNGYQDLNIANAKVDIYEDGVFLSKMVFEPFDAQYYSSVMVKPGKTYRMVLSAPGFADAEATSETPVQVEIEHVKHTKEVRSSPNVGLQDEVRIQFRDPPEEGDYYEVQFLAPINIDSSVTDTMYGGECITSNDPAVESFNQDFFGDEDCLWEAIYLSDKLFNGTTKEFSLYIPSWKVRPLYNASGKLVYPQIRLIRIQEDYFKHAKSMRNSSNARDNPFAEPVNVYSNIKNGYGIFSTTSADMKEIR